MSERSAPTDPSTGSTSPGSTSPGSTSPGSTSPGSAPLGSAPLGSAPLGSAPLGSAPLTTGTTGTTGTAGPDQDAPSESRHTPPYSDIDLHRWRDYDHIWTDSLWLIDSRDTSGGHELDYHGNFVPQIATQSMLRYTKEDDVVLDLFLGSGTSAVEAQRTNRRLIGVELKADLVDYVRRKIDPGLVGDRIHLLQGDSTSPEIVGQVRAQLSVMGAEHAQLLILHPPYHDIITFSDHPADLSRAEDVDQFLDQFEVAARHGLELLEPERFAVLVIGDKYTGGELIPLSFYCLERMQRIGFRPKAIVVKNIEGNERGKGRETNLWRYRALRHGFYIFKHEYVMVFRKPS